MIYKTAILVSMLAAVSAKVFVEDESIQKSMWENFKRDHSKSYASEEEDKTRFGHFLANLKIIDTRNTLEAEAGGKAVHGITRFSDMSQEEFEAKMLKSDASLRSGKAEVTAVATPVNTSAGLVDWTGVLTTPVKNQGYCGSCWAFSATEQIESDAMRTLGTTYILSPEQITQCDKSSGGCNGGWTEHAFNYVSRAGGIETESDYPYTSAGGTTGTCKSDASKFAVSITGYKTVSGESNMAAYVQSTGPLSVCVDAQTWNSYSGGIMSRCGTSIDHCVQAVGVDASTGGYWKVRNSWGVTWGEAGFIRLAYGQNTCGITSDPTYVTGVAKA